MKGNGPKGGYNNGQWYAPNQNQFGATYSDRHVWGQSNPPASQSRGPPVASNFGKGRGKGFPGGVSWPNHQGQANPSPSPAQNMGKGAQNDNQQAGGTAPP